MMHYLKCVDNYFDDIDREIKPFEIRSIKDRHFKVGDDVTLIRVDRDGNVVNPRYKRNVIVVKIKYITNYGQKDDMVVFSFDILNRYAMDVVELNHLVNLKVA